MGLDNFWELPKGNKDIKFNPPLRLCAGMFSGHGEGSFRGKVYDTLIETVTGESLYQEEIPPSIIAKMSASLEEMAFDSLPEGLRSPEMGSSDPAVTREEYEDIRRMFSSYAACGASLKGWW